MSNHINNTRQPSRHPNNAYSRYISRDRVNFDFISPPSLPFPPTLNERVGVDPWLWSLPERNLVLPSSFIRYRPHCGVPRATRMGTFLVIYKSLPQPRMQLVLFRNNLANNTNNMRSRPREQFQQQHSQLTPNEQRNALNKLKKEIYNPTPKKIIKRLSRFYRQNDATKAYGDPKTDKELDEDDDDKRCAICLEDFEAKEVVMVTPCNHMFHEDCILPWVKSNGKCPVCRFSFCGRSGEGGASSANNDNVVDDRLANDLVSFVTLRASPTPIEPLWL